MMISILDSDQQYHRLITRILRRFPHMADHQLRYFLHPRELLTELQAVAHPQIIIIALELAGVPNAGLQIAQQIRQRDPLSQIIITTTNPNAALATLNARLGVLDFVPKNLSVADYSDHMGQALTSAAAILRRLHREVPNWQTLLVGQKHYRCNVADLVAIQCVTNTHNVLFHYSDRQECLRTSIKDCLALSPMLQRVHAGYVVNPAHVAAINWSQSLITTTNNLVLPMSRGYKRAFKAHWRQNAPITKTAPVN